MRLDKYIADTTDYSRSEAKRFIKKGLVTVNNTLETNPQYIIQPEDSVTLREQRLVAPQARYLMFYKPAGVVCTSIDSEHPIISDFIDEPNRHLLQIAGRLDKDTTGLVLLTDDGLWNHRVTSPNKNCKKYYRVSLSEPLDSMIIPQFREGIQLNGEKKKTLPADLTILDEYHAEVAIQEGKYHQVKRMFAAIGNHVTYLHRFQIGQIVLDKTLTPGDYRSLTCEEANSFD